jgi:hypothetical protein
MTNLLLLVQQTNIEEKLKNSPDAGYQTGIIIGSFIPFVLMVVLAYWMYYHFKKGRRNE